jgi:hypothetical protein
MWDYYENMRGMNEAAVLKLSRLLEAPRAHQPQQGKKRDEQRERERERRESRGTRERERQRRRGKGKRQR